MIDYTRLPEMFFFKPYTKEEMFEKSEFLRDMYMALLDIDNERALDYINETMARMLRFMLSEMPERVFKSHCRLQPDKEGRSRLTHEGLLNLLAGCLFATFEEEKLKEYKCWEMKKLIDRHISRNRKALEHAGYDELLELMDGAHINSLNFTIEQRTNTEVLTKAAEENRIDWSNFLIDPDDDDFGFLFLLCDEQYCAAKVFESIFSVLEVTLPDGSNGLLEYANLSVERLNQLPLWKTMMKQDGEIRDLKAELKEQEKKLLERDGEISRLRSLLAQHGLSPDVQQVEEDLSDVADVEVPSIVLHHFRGDRTLALRYLKGCRKHNSPTEAMHDYVELQPLTVQRNDQLFRHGFLKKLCNWLNDNGCDINYNTFKSN